jgi:lysophospholipase L1-like esterase
MTEYTVRLYEDGELRWLPYLMYFQPADHRSDVVNTDPRGFRYSRRGDRTASPEALSAGPVKVLAGNSVAFGVGATNDGASLTSRLWARGGAEAPWLNFGGRSHNSAQELLLFVLHRHLLPAVDEIVVLSGLNNLMLARQPAHLRGDHGAFFMCGQYFEKLNELGKRRPKATADDEAVPDLPGQVAAAAELTVRHLETWRLLADALGARLSFVLQPFAPWVRERPAPQERLLYVELDEVFSFGRQFSDLVPTAVGRTYAEALRSGCEKAGVRFLDMNPVLAGSAAPDEWLFVDRAHCTDQGYALLADLLAEHLELS